MNPSPKNVSEVLESIAAAERPADHPRRLAREAIVNRRACLTPQLTQAQIDSGSETEDRRRRFVASSVKWSKRSLWSKLFSRR